MKIIGKLIGFVSLMFVLGSCTSGYYAYDSYPYPNGAYYYNSRPYYYNTYPYYRGYPHVHVNSTAPYHASPQGNPSHAGSMGPMSHPGAGAPSVGGAGGHGGGRR